MSSNLGDIAVSVNSLSKEYYFFKNNFWRLLWVFADIARYTHKFSALNDVSFSIHKGESFGIIGQNGSGKSTLLKIIAGTSTPTSGQVKTCGRIAALLELGLGFHQDLTGIENIKINGLFSGLTEREISEKIKFIENFSELGEFFYRPVKMYSTGMFMRLAFSMAIAVEPEILIVDEALSVGDQKFQKKCIDYITNLLDRGITLLFCSHDQYTVERLCNRVLWLDKGHVKMLGNSRKVVAAYQESLKEKAKTQAQSFEDPPIIIEDIELYSNGVRIDASKPLEPFSQLEVKIRYHSLDDNELNCHFGLGIYSSDETEMFATSTAIENKEVKKIAPGERGSIEISFPKILLLDGEYTVTGIIQDDTALHVYHRLIKNSAFRVLMPRFEARGTFFMEHKWRLN